MVPYIRVQMQMPQNAKEKKKRIVEIQEKNKKQPRENKLSCAEPRYFFDPYNGNNLHLHELVTTVYSQ